MDIVMNPTEIAQHSHVAAAIPYEPGDDLAFFHALWFWIPAALGVWSAIVWTVLRYV